MVLINSVGTKNPTELLCLGTAFGILMTSIFCSLRYSFARKKQVLISCLESSFQINRPD